MILTGFGRCVIRILRMTSPKVVVGFHGSQWAAYGSDGQPDGHAAGQFVSQVTAGEADYISTDILDRDAGCFEAKPAEFDCGRGATTGWYWDESNQTSPNFHEYLAWARALGEGARVRSSGGRLRWGCRATRPGAPPTTSATIAFITSFLTCASSSMRGAWGPASAGAPAAKPASRPMGSVRDRALSVQSAPGVDPLSV